jgi:putative flippase GtrA
VLLGRLKRGLGQWKVARFAIVSMVSVLTSFILLAFVYGYLRLWSEVPCTLFANVVAGIPAYFLNRQWVWQQTGRSHLRREVIPFWVISIASILLSLEAASLAHHTATVHDLSHMQRTALLIVANFFSFGVLWILKFLMFNRIFLQTTLEAKVKSNP